MLEIKNIRILPCNTSSLQGKDDTHVACNFRFIGLDQGWSRECSGIPAMLPSPGKSLWETTETLFQETGKTIILLLSNRISHIRYNCFKV